MVISVKECLHGFEWSLFGKFDASRSFCLESFAVCVGSAKVLFAQKCIPSFVLSHGPNCCFLCVFLNLTILVWNAFVTVENFKFRSLSVFIHSEWTCNSTGSSEDQEAWDRPVWIHIVSHLDLTIWILFSGWLVDVVDFVCWCFDGSFRIIGCCATTSQRRREPLFYAYKNQW